MNQAGEVACCAVCNLPTYRRCSRCTGVYYCNTEHQREDWKRHKSDCLPKLSKRGRKEKSAGSSTASTSNSSSVPKEGTDRTVAGESVKDSTTLEGDSEKRVDDSVENSQEQSASGDSSVISSVVHAYQDANLRSAITYEGSSEQEILSESAQQLNTVEFAADGPSNASPSVNTSETNMPMLPEGTRKEYPEGILRPSAALFSLMPNNYSNDTNDQLQEVCQRLVRDMSTYGVCVLDNFIGREKGLLVLNEVLTMYRQGIFAPGQLVSTPTNKNAQTIRSDKITWIDGKEPHCKYIGQLISQVDSIVLRANRMLNNGKMGDFTINGRTKAMVACYPGSGSHYVKHVDNPNKDGRCITAIYYLNLNWDVERCGGLLRVFPEGRNQVADIAPIFDRMLFFWSDRRNPHEVQPAFETRYAITLWYFDAYEREEARRHFGSTHICRRGNGLLQKAIRNKRDRDVKRLGAARAARREQVHASRIRVDRLERGQPSCSK